MQIRLLPFIFYSLKVAHFTHQRQFYYSMHKGRKSEGEKERERERERQIATR